MNMSETLKIHTYPDAVLRKKAAPVEKIDQSIQDLIDQMTRIMYAAPGIGLAANQVGEPKRIIVFDVNSKEKQGDPSVLVNPEIILAEGSISYEEACLSVIDYSAEVNRNAQVKVKGLDRDGDPVDIEAEGLLAVCLQHEIDHLDGVLFIDRISSLKKALYKKKLKKMMKNRDQKGS
jgi:peptide deformylase